MKNINKIKDGTKFKTYNGRTGTAYAVTINKLERGTVDLQFDDGPFCVISGEKFKPSHGTFLLDKLTLIRL